MGFCVNCGEELPENAYFCLKCGVRTIQGETSGISYPWNWEKEVEKAFSTATKELEKAFVSVRDTIQRSTKKESITCSQCGEKNSSNSRFCYKCGTKLT